MIYLIHGKDTYSQKKFLEMLRAQRNAELIDAGGLDAEALVRLATSKSLFDKPKVIRVPGAFAAFGAELEDLIDKLVPAGDPVVFTEEKLDKRAAAVKKMLADRRLIVKEFAVPAGLEMNKWIDARAKELGLKFGRGAAAAFAARLGVSSGNFDEGVYDLWQADLELQKLALFAEGKEISTEDVKALTVENISEDVFAITNAIADKDKKRALEYLTRYIDRLPGTDEKSKIISLSAIVAEQFRSMLIVQGFIAQKCSDVAIAQRTGFSSGRLFVYKKIARGFAPEKLREALSKFELLDADIKTSSAPAALPFYMIINSVLS